MLRDISATLVGLAGQWQAEDEAEPAGEVEPRRVKLPERGRSTLASAERVYRSRRGRERLFPASFFGEPAWDMLLDLYISAVKGLKINVTSVCIAGAVPITTGLRWLAILEQEGLVNRTVGPGDGRVTFVEIADKGRTMIESYLDNLDL